MTPGLMTSDAQARAEVPAQRRRRSLLLAIGGSLLTGCSNTGTLDLARQTLALVGRGKGEGYPRSREQIDALPYAQLGVARGDGPRAVLVLAHVNGEEQSWVSGDRVQLVTYRNRVIRTTGLRSDFGRTELLGPDLWDRYEPGGDPRPDPSFERRVRVEPGELPMVAMFSRFRADGTERIDILGQSIDTLRVHEDIDVPEWTWTARNTWWLSRESRLAWRSTQYLTPDQPPLHLDMLKRPA
jgi:hypothetical protein